MGFLNRCFRAQRICLHKLDVARIAQLDVYVPYPLTLSYVEDRRIQRRARQLLALGNMGASNDLANKAVATAEIEMEYRVALFNRCAFNPSAEALLAVAVMQKLWCSQSQRNN